MAGISRIPCCREHGKPCFIKTGTKDGPMKGKTFFICSNQNGQCSFVEPASGIPVSSCPHHGEISDLQALCKKPEGMRCYFRCTEGRKLQLGWCGYTTVSLNTNGTNDIWTGSTKLSERKPLLENKTRSFASAVEKQPSRLKIPLLGKENIGSESNKIISDFQNKLGKDGAVVVSDQLSRADIKETPRLCINDSNDVVSGKVNSIQSHMPKNSEVQVVVPEQGSGFRSKQANTGRDAGVACVSAQNTQAKMRQNGSADVIVLEDSCEDLEDSEGDSRDPTSTGLVKKLQKGISSNNALTCGGGCQAEEHCRLDYERNSLLSRQTTLQLQIQSKKKLIQTVNLQALPDAGQRIFDQVTELETKLKEVKKQCSQLPSQHSCCKVREKDEPVDFSHASKREAPTSLDSEPILASSNVHVSAGSPFQNQRLYDGRMTLSKLKEVGRITKDAIETLHSSLETCPSSSTECRDPVGLLVTLLPHQRQALAWLLWREKQTPSGGILADDMGLGKTLTSIAFILLDKQLGFTKKSTVSPPLRNGSGTLVVCPASLVHHWKKEIDKRVKPLKITVCLYHGPAREKSTDRLARYDVVLTSYSIVEREAKDLIDRNPLKQKKSSAWLSTNNPPPVAARGKSRESPLCQIHWRRIILDEAHCIKNPKSMTSMAACYLEAESRWALTGTPIQNNTKDLYAIIKFLRCSPFDEFKVWNKWVDDKSAKGTARMNTIVRNLLLRRTKQQHLTCLPTRDSVIHNVSLSGNEKEVYDILQLYSRNMLKTYLNNKGENVRDAQPGSKEDKYDIFSGKKLIFGKALFEFLEMVGLQKQEVNAGTILLMVLRLRQCCNHLSLLLQMPDDIECKADGIDVSLEDQMMNMSIVDSDPAKDQWSPSVFKESFISSKVHGLLEELQKLKQLSAGGRPIKSVIVSQWTKMLDVIAYHLRKHGLRHDFITGSVSLKKRSEIVEEFNGNPNGIQIMLVSLKAGGVGLNLIGGSHLFLVDQHWNPALESQASDRIYRVGQTNDVVIHRFLCVNTIEERITALQDKKKALADSVLKGAKDTAKSLTLQDLRMLFGV